MTHKIAVIAFAVLFTGCQATNVTIPGQMPIPADEFNDTASQVCGVLRDAGCPVGQNPNCSQAVRMDQAEGVGSQIDAACILAAGPVPSKLASCHVTCK